MQYVVECGERLYGPFKTAEAAAKFGKDGLVSGARWVIRPVESAR